MTHFPEAATPARGGFVLLDPVTGRPVRTLAFQFNPDTLTRTLQPQGAGEEPGDRLEVLRLKGPPHETLRFEAEFDATEQLADPTRHPREAGNGLGPALAALELSLYPSVAALTSEDQLADRGMIEIAPLESALLVLVLGSKRVLPVRLTELSITEEAFDSALDPIRAKLSIGVRVLTVHDVGFGHKAGQLYLQYHRQKDRWAALITDSAASLGVASI
ncbi:hypothetical protein M6D93_17720 [Jatrophihabitans telluris]|uniref:Uncharacterized protein n=1 Tax=Jatrophihabitans telluris TaxID=2038343 RepID=A0ABY4QZ38_9ACTN|nr:hypothetical protein [Jatrophihabitans telluris]UQX88111.1 hypothetical protein M6D93_17720 [Jatrophihabitans telluris]